MVAQPNNTNETADEFQQRLYERLEHEPIQAIDGACVHCGGMGMLAIEFPVGHRFFGKAWRCICVHRQSEVFKAERSKMSRLERCNIPDIYRSYSLDSFKALKASQGVSSMNSVDEALRLCGAMVNGLPPTIEGRAKQGLYLYGKFGTGKTGLAMSVLNARLDAGVSVHAMDYRMFLGVIQDTYSNQEKSERGAKAKPVTRQQIIDYAAGVDLLLIDDMGDVERIKPISDDQRDITYMLIQQRYLNMRPTIITSNLEPQEFVDQFGGRIAQRVFERCHWCEVGGDGLRS
jgi:DNA replication protein DnaC